MFVKVTVSNICQKTVKAYHHFFQRICFKKKIKTLIMNTKKDAILYGNMSMEVMEVNLLVKLHGGSWLMWRKGPQPDCGTSLFPSWTFWSPQALRIFGSKKQTFWAWRQRIHLLNLWTIKRLWIWKQSKRLSNNSHFWQQIL